MDKTVQYKSDSDWKLDHPTNDADDSSDSNAETALDKHVIRTSILAAHHSEIVNYGYFIAMCYSKLLVSSLTITGIV